MIVGILYMGIIGKCVLYNRYVKFFVFKLVFVLFFGCCSFRILFLSWCLLVLRGIFVVILLLYNMILNFVWFLVSCSLFIKFIREFFRVWKLGEVILLELFIMVIILRRFL